MFEKRSHALRAERRQWWEKGLSCTPTALCALSAKTPAEVAALLQEAAIKHGREIGPELRDSYNINDWLEVVNKLGGNWTPGEDYSDLPFKNRPTIDEWMGRHLGVEPELVFCDDNGDIGHVFATVDKDVVDRRLRVKRTFLVE
jgi:hypothetical protein